MTRLKPWDRQPGETDPAWEAFVCYRDLGYGRSTAKVRQQLGKSKRLIERWSAGWGWVRRVEAYDAEQDRLWQHELHHQRREDADRTLAVARATMVAAGNRVMQLAQSPEQLKAADAARLMEAATRLRQWAYGTAPPIVAAGDDSSAVDDMDLDSLSDEEIRAHMLALRRELDSALAEYPDRGAGDNETEIS